MEALVITSMELVVLNESRATHLRYDRMLDIDRLTKDELPEFIVAHLDSGEIVSIPVRGRTGAIVDIMRFLLSAMREAAKRRDRGYLV
jgi:hypothetical protein